jgi:hypothetical protein
MRSFHKYLGAASLTAGLLFGGVALLPGDSPVLAKPPIVERHPHIHKALRELKRARRELATATHDFSGHRAAALAQVDQAIKQCDICLKIDRH